MSSGWTHLCALEDVSIGESKGFDPLGTGKDTIFIVRVNQYILHAYLNDCPHVPGARMAWKKDKFLSNDGSYITCFAHGALFQKESGVCISGPCLGKSLTSIEVEVRNQQVHVWLGDKLIRLANVSR